MQREGEMYSVVIFMMTKFSRNIVGSGFDRQCLPVSNCSMNGSCDRFCVGSELWISSQSSSDSTRSNKLVFTKESFSRAVAVQAFCGNLGWQLLLL